MATTTPRTSSRTPINPAAIAQNAPAQVARAQASSATSASSAAEGQTAPADTWISKYQNYSKDESNKPKKPPFKKQVILRSLLSAQTEAAAARETTHEPADQSEHSAAALARPSKDVSPSAQNNSLDDLPPAVDPEDDRKPAARTSAAINHQAIEVIEIEDDEDENQQPLRLKQTTDANPEIAPARDPKRNRSDRTITKANIEKNPNQSEPPVKKVRFNSAVNDLAESRLQDAARPRTHFNIDELFEHPGLLLGNSQATMPKKYEDQIDFLIKAANSGKINHRVVNKDHYNFFETAVKSGNFEAVKIIYLADKAGEIERSSDKAQDLVSKSPVFWCIEHNNPDMLRLLMKMKYPVNSHDKTDCYHTPLTKAASLGYTNLIKILKENQSISFSKRDINGLTPLMHAAIGGHLESVKEFMTDRRTTINLLRSPQNFTALDYALHHGHRDVANYLTDCMENTKKDISTNLARAQAENININIGININSINRDGSTALMRCISDLNCQNNNTNGGVKYFLRIGANPNLQNNIGETAFHTAAHRGDYNIINSISAFGGYVDAVNRKNETPLFYAIRSGSRDAVGIILQLGSNVNHTNDDGDSPLHVAVNTGNLDIVRALVSRNANVRSTNHRSETPLTIAQRKGNAQICAALAQGLTANRATS